MDLVHKPVVGTPGLGDRLLASKATADTGRLASGWFVLAHN
ncbi:hypothetical protein AB0950_38050 [Streptomyces sp. NPDC007189]